MTAVSAPVLATILMVIAVAITGLQNCIIRLVADRGIHAFELVFFRNVFGFASAAVVAFWAERGIPRTRWVNRLSFACVLHVASMCAGFLGVALLPLNESSALGFALPLFVTIGAALFLGEKIRARRIAAVIAGFVGVLIILRPGMVPISFGAAAVLVSAAIGAGVTLLFKTFAGTERPTTLIFYQCLISSFLSLPMALWVWRTPDAWELALMAGTGILGTMSWVCFLRACAVVDASALQPLEFARLPFVAIFAYLMFGEVPDQWVWLGAAVIFSSTLYIAHREALAARRSARSGKAS